MRNQTRTSSILTLTLLLAGAAGSARAQDALGDGRVLDSNTGQYGPSNYQRPSLMDELRFRNSIATGNAPGGLSFRGDVGYRAPGEFTGQLGSDSLFAFRRDSLYSGLAGMGIRGTDALQYQFALTTGAAPPRNLMGNLSYTRDNAFSSSSAFSYDPVTGTNPHNTLPGQPLSIDQTAAGLDTRGRQLSAPSQSFPGADSGSLLGTLRSSSTYATTSPLQPSLMSVYAEGVDRTPMGMISSPLLGITTTPMVDPNKPANPLVARPSNADTDPTTPGGLDSTRINTSATGPRESTRLTTSYDQLVNEMRQRVETMRQEQGTDTPGSIKPGESNDAWLIRQMEDLRQKLYGNKPANTTTDDNTQDAAGTDPNTPAQSPTQNPDDPAAQGQNPGQTGNQDATQPGAGLGDLPPLVAAPGMPDNALQKEIDSATEGLEQAEPGVQMYDPTDIAVDPETLELLRGSAAREVKQLLDPNQASDADLYARHMSAGQKLIGQGQYFDAEERFTNALSLRPGDVPSQLGRLHAQIGAGMILSASVNMQSLFSTHPELITSKYADNLMPSPERIESLKTRLRERAGLINYEQSPRVPEGARIQVSAGMLLAYLGYQTEDAATIKQGLGVVREKGTDSDRRFASLLSQLWVAQGTKNTSTDKKSSPGE